MLHVSCCTFVLLQPLQRGHQHSQHEWRKLNAGRPRFGSVRLRFGDGTVQAVPVFGSGGSSAKRVFSRERGNCALVIVF